MAGSNSEYRGLNQPTDNEDEDFPPQFTSLLHDQEKSKWSHIDDLDEFFTRIYQYHQNHGMPSLIFMEFLNLFQIFFLATFSIFMLECVDYTTLFQNQKIAKDQMNASFVKKTTIPDVIYPMGQCIERFSLKIWFLLIIVVIFWLFRLIKAIYNIACYAEIRSFYNTALNIQSKDLQNTTWHEVQEKLITLQKKHQICIHKQDLTELDIYNRILRFKNYQVAMVNQGLLPPRVNMPALGDVVCFTNGFKYNFEFLFFWGPFAPFTNSYQLRPEFKVFSKRNDLISELKKSMLILGVLNILLAPIIFIWQLLQFLYNYTELIKRDPAVLGNRRWSNYGRLYFRHFNELDHELEARLSRAYKPSNLYLSSFVSQFLVNIAKFFLFTFGAIFAVLVVLAIIDEDVLNVEHVLTIISITGAIAGVARTLIPEENAVYFMDQMMYQILAHVHYMPDSWKTHANSMIVRDEFVKLFQYKFVYFLEELMSPIITPFIILFWLRPKAGKFVDFLRNFTIDVTGVGDVCSFSQMDTRRHGNPQWLSKTKTKRAYQAKNGKTELSLIHFVHTNPNWKMPMESMAFIDQIRDQASRETTIEENVLANIGAATSSINQMSNILDNKSSLNRSLYQLQPLIYNSTNLARSQALMGQLDSQTIGQFPTGAISRLEGPLLTNKQERQTLLSIAQASTLQLSSQTLLPMPTAPNLTTALESSLDMCFSALYMHELHRKYHYGDYIDLDNVKEENDEGLEDQENENNFDTPNNYTSFSGGKLVRHENNSDSNDSDNMNAYNYGHGNNNNNNSNSGDEDERGGFNTYQSNNNTTLKLDT